MHGSQTERISVQLEGTPGKRVFPALLTEPVENENDS